MGILLSHNPATGELIRELVTTDPSELPEIFARAKAAQLKWATVPVHKRATQLLLFRETILNHLDEIVALISNENGKPPFEALSNEVIPSIEHLTYLTRNLGKFLSPKKIPLSLMRHRKSILRYSPLGTVLIISPWNFPWHLPIGSIATALASGNAVIFKPSEYTPAVGLKIQELAEESGLPKGLLQTLIGNGVVAEGAIHAKPAKIFFTGSTSTGKKILRAAAEHLTPVNLELGGKDAMIVMADADLDFASSAALWGGFSNSGQVCASVERLILHETIARDFLDRLRNKALLLRQSPTAPDRDLGAITLPRQKLVYEKQLAQARQKDLRFIVGGEFSEGGELLRPTVVTGADIELTEIYQEETFGPVIAVTQFKTPSEAIEKANDSRYGLTASIITRNLKSGSEMAQQLEAGSVLINETTYTGGLAETPWGGTKESGYGRTHGESGFYEFVQSKHIHLPRSKLFVFKSLWWFPYTPFQFQAFRRMADLYRLHWSDRVRVLPHFLWNLAQLLRNEKRL